MPMRLSSGDLVPGRLPQFDSCRRFTGVSRTCRSSPRLRGPRMRSVIQHCRRLTYRNRGQARSYSVSVVTRSSERRAPCRSRSRLRGPRMRSVIQHCRRLTYRNRGQARSYSVSVVPKSSKRRAPCRSRPSLRGPRTRAAIHHRHHRPAALASKPACTQGTPAH